MLTEIISSFEAEKTQTKYNVLVYRIDLYGYKLAIEIDENGYSDRNIEYQIKREKAIEQEIGCKSITIVSDIWYFNWIEFSFYFHLNLIFESDPCIFSFFSNPLFTQKEKNLT